MRTLVVSAHPSPTSFTAALSRQVCAVLEARGHAVDACDLYAEAFDPVIPLESYRRYLDAPANRIGVERYVERLLAADGLVFIFPVWHDGPPAILKGYFDRIFLRGVVFEIDAEGVFFPMLQNIRFLGAVALYGADRARTRKVGDLPRRFFKHNLAPLAAANARLDYLAAYGMDHADDNLRNQFANQVRRRFLKW